VVVEETGVVVIVNKEAESVEVFEVGLLRVVSLLDFAHVLLATEHITDGVVHRVVEKTSDSSLVGSNVSGITVEALSHLEDASSITKLRPKVFGNLGDGVDPYAIKAVSVNHVLDPGLELTSDVVV